MKLAATITGIIASMSASTAFAQSIVLRWPTTSHTVYYHTAMPLSCDNAIGRSASNWNASGSRWSYHWDKAGTLTGTRGTANSAGVITIEDGYTSNGTALGTARVYSSGSTITSVDVLINADHLWYYGDESGGRFHCPVSRSNPPSNSFDLESTVTHELGHALGFGEADNTSCVMNRYQAAGIVRRTPCSVETTAMKNAYGSR